MILKNVNLGMKGDYLSETGVSGHFVRNRSLKFFDFCMIVEGNMAQH